MKVDLHTLPKYPEDGWEAIDEARPGCVSYGKTGEEARINLAAAQLSWDEAKRAEKATAA